MLILLFLEFSVLTLSVPALSAALTARHAVLSALLCLPASPAWGAEAPGPGRELLLTAAFQNVPLS